MTARTKVLGIRLPIDTAMLLEQVAGGDVRQWILTQLDQALHGPDPAEPPPTDRAAREARLRTLRHADWQRGWEQGRAFERLAWYFEQGQEAQLDRAAIGAWAEAHPADWLVIAQAALRQPWADRFARWWQPPAESGRSA